MLRVILFTGILLITASTHAEKRMEVLRDIINSDQWAVAEGTHNDLPLMIRFRNKLSKDSSISNHPQLIRIYWDYSPHESGMPSTDDSQSMEVFENRLVDALETDLSGVLAAAITTNGYREWVWYCVSTEVFAESLHNMPQETEPYPIEIEAESDPEWDYFFSQVRPE
ncbi:hypothetical protein CWB72_19675 [Pseudoalteromonas phenolica]|uniref:DUF695 domain-containing protein n=1 Tax=Pseudoalteromonas phenolica TaxID=161398 RepID=UPI00110A4D87|nr:hypothetical protein CWB72_19675 [Pseudoalteromonas phenolica]